MDTTPETQSDSESQEPTVETAPEATEKPSLGPEGERALRAERSDRKAAEAALKEAQARIAELEKSTGQAEVTDVQAIREELRAEFSSQLVRTQIEAEAKGRLADPSDALAYLNPADYAPGDEAISEAVTDLLTRKPYLAAQETPRWGDVGGHGDTTKPEPKSAMERLTRAYGA